MPNRKGQFLAYLTVLLAYLVGSVSLLAWMGFLFFGSPELVNLDLSESGIYAFNTCLCLAFFLQHSIMTRKFFRKWLAGQVPEAYAGAVYTLLSGIILLVQVILWQKSVYGVLTFQGIYYGAIRSVFFLSLVGFISGIRALNSFDAFGVNPIIRQFKGESPETTASFTAKGPYRWVRHPLYFFCLLFIWSCPMLSGDRLLFNMLWTGWIIFATRLEERDLVSVFGSAYQDYQRRVPRLIPWRIPARTP